MITLSMLSSMVWAMKKKDTYPKKVCHMPQKGMSKIEKRCMPKQGMPHAHKACQKKCIAHVHEK